ncbi:MAG TPA: hypothetical protein ENJ06_01370 [Phycisphaeraceae bacterium]|nr:hypothetical protein [Phycisphaeraceae bacterium]
MDPAITQRLNLSFEEVLRPRAHDLATKFYDRLNEQLPQLQDMLPVDPNDRRQQLLSALTLAMTNVKTPECIVDPYQALITSDEMNWDLHDHLEKITETLVNVMSEIGGHMWTPQLDKDWTEAMTYTGIAPEAFFG